MKIRNDLVENAINCAQAYAVLAISSDGDERRGNMLPCYSYGPRNRPWTVHLSLSDSDSVESPRLAELRSVVNALKGSLFGVPQQSTVDWLLRIMPHTLQHRTYQLLNDDVASRSESFVKLLPPEQVGSLSTQSLADYLLCMNVVLGFKPHR
jgi:hypothetical protein